MSSQSKKSVKCIILFFIIICPITVSAFNNGSFENTVPGESVVSCGYAGASASGTTCVEVTVRNDPGNPSKTPTADNWFVLSLDGERATDSIDPQINGGASDGDYWLSLLQNSGATDRTYDGNYNRPGYDRVGQIIPSDTSANTFFIPGGRSTITLDHRNDVRFTTYDGEQTLVQIFYRTSSANPWVELTSNTFDNTDSWQTSSYDFEAPMDAVDLVIAFSAFDDTGTHGAAAIDNVLFSNRIISAQAVPTMSQWANVLLILTLASIGLLVSSRRQV